MALEQEVNFAGKKEPKPSILVTGAGGYIGSITADLFLANGYKVIALDNFSRGYRDPLKFLINRYGPENMTYYDLDLTRDPVDIFRYQQIDAVVHFAGFADVGESWRNPSAYFRNNVVASQNLAEAMMKNGVRKMVFSSSCAVYGDAQYLPIDENHPLGNPSSPYGSSKKMSEEIFRWYSKLGLLDGVFLRYFNVTGASDDFELGDSKKPSYHLIQNAILGAMGLKQFELNYSSVDTPDGSPIRDYVNVVDLGSAHTLALSYLLDGRGSERIFNLGTGTGYSVLQIVDLIKQKTGSNFPVNLSNERRKTEPSVLVADNTKAKRVLGWNPTHTLEQSIDSLIQWYLKHSRGWDKLVNE